MTLSDQIRRAVDNSGLSHYAVCKAAEIDQGAFSHFMHGRRGLSLESLDRLGVVLNLEVVARTGKGGR